MEHLTGIIKAQQIESNDGKDEPKLRLMSSGRLICDLLKSGPDLIRQ